MSEIRSPITGETNVRLVRRLHKNVIARDYREKMNVDVSRFYDLAGESLEIYECLDTGLKFYQPDSLAGDGPFYDSINAEGYYPQWKKEYQFGKETVQRVNAKRVLDVGCGSGQFVESIATFAEATGLELSEEALRAGRNKQLDLDLRNEPIASHAASHQEYYDCVCAFQVLEHVPKAKEFLSQLICCLKPGGSLILSVPNCEPYATRNHWYGIANLPPHHMGLWNLAVFSKLPNYFPLELTDSSFDLNYSILEALLASGLSKAKDRFPNVKSGMLIRVLGAVLAVGLVPFALFSEIGASRHKRVMVHFKKTEQRYPIAHD